jgi:hypothetical protein
LVQSFRRLTAHKQHPILGLPIDVDVEIEASFTATLPNKPAAQKPEKKTEAQAAA